MSGKSLSRLLLSFLPESVSGAPQYVEDTRGVQSADFVCLLRQTCDQKFSFFFSFSAETFVVGDARFYLHAVT